MVAVAPRHVTWVPSSVHTPYMKVWRESKTTELLVRESACTTSELLPK